MFVRSTHCLALVSILLSGCMLIGYDSLVDGSESDTSTGRDDASTGNDAMFQDAMGGRDAFIPPITDAAGDRDAFISPITDGSIDASEEATVPDGAMDSSQQDASDSATDSAFDDAPSGECETGEVWCEEEKLYACDSTGAADLIEDCATYGNRCELGVCNASEGKCEKQPVSNDTHFCDGDLSMSCNGLGSAVTAEDCSAASTICSTGVCDLNTGQCKLEPTTADRYWCEDDVLYTCNNSGTPTLSQDCSELDEPCYNGVCDSTNHVCIKQPVALNSSCLGYGQCDETGTCICTESDVWCYGDQLLSCSESGLAVDREDCSAGGDACNVGVCDSDDNTCNKEPISGNPSCGLDGTCDSQGRCVFGNESCSTGIGGRCDISCDPAISSCLLDCSDTTMCAATCEAGASCDIECSASLSCTATCESGSVCNLSCTDTTVSCDFDCQEAESCYNVSCPGLVGCVLTCDPLFSNCSFDSCSDVTDCGNGVYACNTTCPPTI